jgi:hypothetical protein
MDHIPFVGPIPRGRYRIEGPPVDTESHGDYVLRLTPTLATDTKGRHGFLMHGAKNSGPAESSQGCIVMPFGVRKAVWLSGDYDLMVQA